MTVEYTFFSRVCETFSRVDYMLGHKTSPSKLKKIKIIQNIFSVYKGMKVKINSRRETRKFINM